MTSSSMFQPVSQFKQKNSKSSFLHVLNMSDFISGSIYPKKIVKTSRSKHPSEQNKTNKKLFTEPVVDFPRINQTDISFPNLHSTKRNENYIKKKLMQIQTSSKEKVNKLYRAQLSLTQPNTPLSNSKQNLCKSVLKKLSIKLSKDKQKNHNSLPKVVDYGRVVFYDNLGSLKAQKVAAGQKIRQTFEAYTKNENERIIRLLQRQEQLEEKYSSIKKGIKEQIKQKQERKLSKKDFHLYSRSHRKKHFNTSN